jgi:outer membrane protein assembly factor BamB
VFPLTGEWTCFRANGALDGYALGKGLASRPAIAWRQQVGRTETLLVVEPGGGSETISLPGEVTANGLDEARDARWGYTPATAEFGDDRVSLANTSTTTYAHVLPDEPGLQKLEFGDSFGTGEPVGRCYAWRDGRWEQVWETEPVQLAFSPRPIAGDFDGDGNVEVAILPWDLLWIFDGQTGHLEERCALSGGRNYGFYGAYDLDGDGKSEFVVLADFAKHVDVIGYRSGALERLWNLDVELGIQDPQKVLRVNPNPVADVDGDGKLEVLVSLWDGHDDGRWHVTVHDGMTGAIKHDLADELLQGVVDVTGDGVSELLTVRTVGRNASPYGAVMVRSCRGEGVTTLWEREGAAWQTWDRPLPLNVNSGATLGQRDVLWREIAERARVVLAQTAPATSDSVFLSVLEWGESGLEPVVEIAGPALEALGMDEEGNLLLSSGTLPGASGSVVIGSGRGRVLAARPRRDVPGPVIVGRSPGTDWPVIVAQGGGEEMVAFHAPADGDEQGTELWRHQGWGQGINWYWGTWHPLADGWESPPSAAVKNQVLGPVLVDLSGDGGRQCLYATVAPTGCARLEAVDLVTGDVVWRHDLSDLPGTIPIWNTGGILLWRAGRFTDLEKQDVVLTVRRGIMHSEEIRMLRGRDGSQLWRRQRQSTYEDGIGGVLTVADYTGDGLDEVLSYYSSSKEIYNVLRGETGEDVRCWVQGIAPCANYDGAIGIAGDMLGDGETSLFLANTVTGLATRGDLMVWATGRSDSPKCLPAFGDLDGDGRLEAVVVENAEGFDVVCYDVAGGEVEWRLPALAETAPAGSASADVDGDGRDEALFVVDKTLYCFGLPRREVQGALLWQIDLPAAVGPPTVADVDGDGRLSILLAGSDGYVYCVR